MAKISPNCSLPLKANCHTLYEPFSNAERKQTRRQQHKWARVRFPGTKVAEQISALTDIQEGQSFTVELMVLITLYERYFVLLVIFYFLTFHPSRILIAPTINTLHSCSSCCRRWASQTPLFDSSSQDHCVLSMLPWAWAPTSKGSSRISNQCQALPPCYPGQLEQRQYLHRGSGTLSGHTQAQLSHRCIFSSSLQTAASKHCHSLSKAQGTLTDLKKPKPSKQKDHPGKLCRVKLAHL